MPSFIARWPIWYLLVVVSCFYLGVAAFRHFQRSQPGLEAALANASTPHDRGQIAGHGTRLLSPVVLWPLAALGLLTGAFWIQWLVAAGFLLSARVEFRDYATGFAEGSKAGELASSPEYVAGRVRPTRAAYVAAAVFVGVTRVVPAVALVYATWLY
jgi:hypothetical protein